MNRRFLLESNFQYNLVNHSRSQIYNIVRPFDRNILIIISFISSFLVEFGFEVIVASYIWSLNEAVEIEGMMS